MTDPINTPPRPPNPEDAGSKSSSAAAPRTSAPDADATGPVPAVKAAPPGLDSVTGEQGYTARHAAETGSAGTTDRSTSGQPSAGQSHPDPRSTGQGSPDRAKSDQAKGAAQDVAGDAKEAGQAVKDTAAQEAAGVKDDAVREAKRLGGEAGTMLESQAADQLDRAAGTVRTFSDDVARIARGEKPEPGVAKDLVDQLNSRAEATATWLEDHDPKEVLHEVQGFARRRPVAFLAIAAGVGFAAGRLTRGIAKHHADDDQSSSSTANSGSGAAAGTAAGPVPGTVPTGGPAGGPAGSAAGSPATGAPAYDAGPGAPTPGYPGGTDPYAGGGGR